MEGSWKTVLNEYVYRLNRAEIDRTPELLADIVKDRRYMDHLRSISRHTFDSNRVWPYRSETRARIDRLTEVSQKVMVRLQLTKKWHSAQSPVQEVMEYEDIVMQPDEGVWMITKVDRAVPERRSKVAHPPKEEVVGASLPFINRQVLSKRLKDVRAIRYDREAARAYADLWWNAANPKYHHFEVDCTNYVSQCFIAGGIPMHYTGKRDSGWWYEGYAGGQERWSYSWAVAQSLQAYLLQSTTGFRGLEVKDPRALSIGDMISYDWDGDGRYQHTTIVTGFNGSGYPLVNAHTNNSRNRYWDYRDSYAWSEKTRYTFIHIPDVL